MESSGRPPEYGVPVGRPGRPPGLRRSSAVRPERDSMPSALARRWRGSWGRWSSAWGAALFQRGGLVEIRDPPGARSTSQPADGDGMRRRRSIKRARSARLEPRGGRATGHPPARGLVRYFEPPLAIQSRTVSGRHIGIRPTRKSGWKFARAHHALKRPYMDAKHYGDGLFADDERRNCCAAVQPPPPATAVWALIRVRLG